MSSGMKKRKDAEELLPLRPAHYLILLSLTDGDRHGYALKKDVIRRTDGKVTLGAGSLYRSISQLVDLNLIEVSGWRPDPAVDDERRQYYRLTKLGRAVAVAETERLAALVRDARASGLTG
jgi:DNA-binding PadR family transcriptional regulator